MKRAELPNVLGNLRCPVCQHNGWWVSLGAAAIRSNSTISKFRCGRCGKKIVIKISHGGSAQSVIKREFDVLIAMSKLHSQEEHFRFLTPLAYAAASDNEMMVTELVEGPDLAGCARMLPIARSSWIYGLAGKLLRKLHEACSERHLQAVDLQEKVTYLNVNYGSLLDRMNISRNAFDALRSASVSLHGERMLWTWGHGDFKPQNVIYDGDGIVAFDTTLDNVGAFIFDIGQFLANIELLFLGWKDKAEDIRPKLASEFLNGYDLSTSDGLSAVAWAQLYFTLAYYGEYCASGTVRKIVAWRVFGGAIDRSTRQLVEAIGKV